MLANILTCHDCHRNIFVTSVLFAPLYRSTCAGGSKLYHRCLIGNGLNVNGEHSAFTDTASTRMCITLINHLRCGHRVTHLDPIHQNRRIRRVSNMFIVKAAYGKETRRFTFAQTSFPSFGQLYSQVSNLNIPV